MAQASRLEMLNGEAVETTRKMEVWLLLASFARFAQKLPRLLDEMSLVLEGTKSQKSICNGDFRFVGILACGRVLR